MNDESGAAKSNEPGRLEDRISRFDAAGYIFQMVGEMSELSRKCGFEALTQDLERARDNAAQAMIETRRGE
jgi:hypothetical protein